MQIHTQLSDADCELFERQLQGFVPEQVFDAHAHLADTSHFSEQHLPPFFQPGAVLGLREYQQSAARSLPSRQVEGLFFGFPNRQNDRHAINNWLADEVREGGGNNRGLLLTSLEDDPAEVAAQIRRLGLVGIKPYHLYASRTDTMHAGIEEFAPEWMWELCHDMKGVLMLHIVRERAIADEDNQKDLRRLCRKYPQCRLVLAHVARSFNYRHALEGLSTLIDLDNVWLDTSAIADTTAFSSAIETLGTRRLMFGTDYPVSDLRGKCTAVGDNFFWLHPETINTGTALASVELPLVGIESLLCLREACEQRGLNEGDIRDIFRNNALRLLEPHLEIKEQSTPSGIELWSEAKTKISGGTGLLSKFLERYDPQSWPTYFSRTKGCHVWDLEGNRYVDFQGGIGAVLLGYSDPDVNAALRRRADAGTHSSLISPDEVELADLFLELHPWAGRVRFARGGGEAMAVAVRIARAATGRSGVAFCGYHGWHDWYLAANLGEDDALDGHLLPGLQPRGVPRELKGTAMPFRYNDLASFDEAMARLDHQPAAVVMEPMRSQRPQDGFLEAVAERCRKAGAILVVDEITSGWRLGFPGACAMLGLEPDIVVYAKAMSNGVPCAAVVGRVEPMDAAESSFISSTYWTDGLGPAAALSCIRKMGDNNVQQAVWQKGELLQRGLERLIEEYSSISLQLSGMPPALSLTFDLGEEAQAARVLLIRKMVQRGYLATGLFYIMWAHEEQHITGLLAALKETLGDINELASAGRLSDEAGSGTAHAGFARLA